MRKRAHHKRGQGCFEINFHRATEAFGDSKRNRGRQTNGIHQIHERISFRSPGLLEVKLRLRQLLLRLQQFRLSRQPVY